MLASEPMKERPLLEVAMDEAAFVQLILEGHAVVITWPPCPHVRLGRRRLWSASVMVVVRRGSVYLSCPPYEGSNDDVLAGRNEGGWIAQQLPAMPGWQQMAANGTTTLPYRRG